MTDTSTQMAIIESTDPEIEEMLIVLRSSALRQPPMIDSTFTSEWCRRLRCYAIQDLHQAAETWTGTEEYWPSLAAFIDFVERAQNQRTRTQRNRTNPKPDGVCVECGEQGGWTAMGDEAGTGTSRPCSRCRPVQFALWRDGCFHPHHHGCEKCKPGRLRSRSRG